MKCDKCKKQIEKDLIGTPVCKVLCLDCFNSYNSKNEKEIEELKKDIKSQKAVADLYLTIASSSATKMSIADAVRKYICEEIREQCVYISGTKQVCPSTSISTYNLNEILNKIEKDIENGN